MGHLELNEEYQLLTNGFVIFKEEEKKWVLKKVSVKNSDEYLDPIFFESYESAKSFALTFIQKQISWNAIIRYDRGLGVEYKTFENIIADCESKAQETAYELMLEILKDKNLIKEIKVKKKK